ncbi:hypothetical protein D7294_27750 [Streptomyces hoynatensis]|uniref:Putative sensor domain-containing protein n=2 Tax=Streptomyces hoynatensis TaxID=1141874 RepID=A0A3A9YPZ3_9ACTN|nr:hypothetical protein D7294_27750 [Streptomyces hoynatensis]
MGWADSAGKTAVGHASGSPAGREAGQVSGAGRFWRRLGYLLGGLPVGIAAFTAGVTGLCFGVGTFLIWIGLPALVGTLFLARAFAALERRQVAAVTGRPIPAPRYRIPSAGESGLARLLGALGDAQSWRDLAHLVAAFPIRVLTFSLAFTWTVGGLGELLYATWSWPLPRDDEGGLLDLMFGIDGRLPDVAFNTAIGVVLLATAVPMLRGLTALQTSLARALLGGRPAASAQGISG